MTPSRQEIDHPTSSSSSSSSPPVTSSTVWSESVARQERWDPCGIDHYIEAVSSEHFARQERWDPCSSGISEEQLLTEPTKIRKNKYKWESRSRTGRPVPFRQSEWLREFRENLVDDRVPEHRDSHASSSHGSSLEPTPARSADLGKHSVYTHFPKDRNCEICQGTNITRALCRRRTGGVVPRAEIFGDLITADHKVLSEGCESPQNHRYAVVVQDLATQWIQSYPCKTKTSQKTQRSLQKFLEPNTKPKVIYTDNSLEFGETCEDLSWNHCTSTPHRSETNGIAERAVRRVKEGTSAVLLQSGLDETCWADSMECFTFCKTFKISCLMGKHHTRDVLGNHLRDRTFRLVHWLSITLSLRNTSLNPSIWKESLTWIVPWIRSARGENLEGWHIGCRHWGVGHDGRNRKSTQKKTQCKGSNIS